MRKQSGGSKAICFKLPCSSCFVTFIFAIVMFFKALNFCFPSIPKMHGLARQEALEVCWSRLCEWWLIKHSPLKTKFKSSYFQRYWQEAQWTFSATILSMLVCLWVRLSHGILRCSLLFYVAKKNNTPSCFMCIDKPYWFSKTGLVKLLCHATGRSDLMKSILLNWSTWTSFYVFSLKSIHVSTHGLGLGEI